MACPAQSFQVQNVTKIPIAGPAPYNTLVVCTPGGPIPSDVHVTRARTTILSNYQLKGFDPSNPPPQFVHTTCAWVGGTAAMNLNDSATGKDAWMYAVDDIPNAGFNQDGYFYVEVDTATMVPPIPLKFQSEGTGFMMACSYILVVEPQPGPPKGRKPRPFPRPKHPSPLGPPDPPREQ
jgi:hypothetical protein